MPPDPLAADYVTMSHFSCWGLNCVVLHHVALEMHTLENSAIISWVRLETNSDANTQVDTAACGSHYTPKPSQHTLLYTNSGKGIYGMYNDLCCGFRFRVWTRWSGFRSAATNCWPQLALEFGLLGALIILKGEIVFVPYISGEILETVLDKRLKRK